MVRSDLERIELLIAHGAIVDELDDSGFTVLAAAVSSRCPREHVDALLAAGARVRDAEPARVTALMVSAALGDLDAVEHLLAREAAVGVTDGDGRTALHYAVDPSRRLRSWLSGLMRFFPPDPLSIPRAAFGKSANTEAGTVVDRLIVFGADVNAGDAEGVTPLMLAAGHGDAALVERLLKAGARRDATDEQGKAAIDYATSSARGSEAAAAIRRLLAGDDGGSP